AEEHASGPRDAQGLPAVEDTQLAATAIGAGVTWRRKPHLCFGAVDWHARVWVNGRFAGEHSGGYTPFDLDLSRYVRPGQPVTLARESGADEPGDVVSTYFGMRSITRGFWNDNPYEYVLLNGEPIYLRGALDQAFHPDGLHTYPTDDAIRADIQAARDVGLNM